MGIKKTTKLNKLLSNWPNGQVMTASYLASEGYSYQLLQKYIKSRWLHKIGQGAFNKLNSTETCHGVLNALKEQLKIKIHLGGLSSLEYYGFSHYVNSSQEKTCFVYNDAHAVTRLPAWTQSLSINVRHVKKVIFKTDLGVVSKESDKINFSVSRPERAILELISLCPKLYSLQFVSEHVESLQLLDGRLVQALLEECKSVKIKRLFLYFADSLSLPCFNSLDVSKVDLGCGKRVIGSGGLYISKYKLSIPENINNAVVPDV